MISEGEMLFQLGAVMLLAFLGEVLASRFKQSVMIGYIVIGIFLGPYIHIGNPISCASGSSIGGSGAGLFISIS